MHAVLSLATYSENSCIICTARNARIYIGESLCKFIVEIDEGIIE